MEEDILDEDFDEIEPPSNMVNQETQDFNAVYDHAMDDLAAIGPPGQFSPAETLEPEKSFWEQASDFFIDKLAPEIGDMLMQQTAKGAAELSQALFSDSNAYVAYGYTQQPMEVEDTQSFDAMLDQASQRAMPEQDQQLER